MMKYEKYKPSEIDWIGNVPNHWGIIRIKDVFNQISKIGSEIGVNNYIPLENIESQTGKLIQRISNENNEVTNLFKKGDILVNKLRPYLAKVYLPEFDGGVSGEVIVFRVSNVNQKKISSKYYFYRFLSRQFIEKINSITDGVKMPRTNPTKINCLEIAIPPLSEQTAIAEYLDAKTQAIDKKINLLTQKAEMYKELRKSIINDAVCKGLDKNVKLKESGIDWIGKIPEHWEVERLKALGEIETSSVNKKIEEEEELVKLVNYTDVYGNMNKEIWNSDSYMVVSANKLQLRFKILRQGDVLFTPSSETIADIGVSAVVMEDLKNTLYSYHILRLKFSLKMQLNFKKYLFNNDFVQEYFSKSATGTTRKILGLNTFYNLPVVFPPTIEEQTAIANYLDEKTQKIDAIVSNIGKQIDTLKELRKTLINDVVTGKIKVFDPLIDID
jgi:type I restriction enzyme S subunit